MPPASASSRVAHGARRPQQAHAERGGLGREPDRVGPAPRLDDVAGDASAATARTAATSTSALPSPCASQAASGAA